MLPDQSISDAYNKVERLARNLVVFYGTNELDRESRDIVKKWSQAPPFNMFGMMEPAKWLQFCCNMAFVAQTIIRYGDSLLENLRFGHIATDNIKTVLEVHEKFRPHPPTKQCIEMIMETWILSSLSTRSIRMSGVCGFDYYLTPQIIEDRIRPSVQTDEDAERLQSWRKWQLQWSVTGIRPENNASPLKRQRIAHC